MLARVEYRWEVLYRMSAIVLLEEGEVAPSRTSFSLNGAHTAFGGGLRLGLSGQSTLRFEIAKADEGPRTTLTIGGDF